ncbi:MAG TPA: SDR family NAD(P)-dependent oxidoreductase [Gemmatimonadales bacterium]|nr:SDR family NAD(P)-dependent oxidoreductase [Gemmatimonadales bacterium]
MIDLTGQTVLITGGSRGIGAAAALLFAKAGADVVVTYHSRADEAARVVGQVKGLGRKGWAFGGDHSDPKVVERIFRELDAVAPRLDAAVINHGIWPPEEVPLARMDDARWARTMRVNLDSLFAFSRGSLARLRPGGTLILVSSTAGQRGEAFHADYAATKGAVISLTKSLAVECGPDLRVNCVAPGWVDTEMSAAALHGPERAKIDAAIPLRRPASAEDVAGPILFLASPLARHITGEIVNVNGGSVLAG